MGCISLKKQKLSPMLASKSVNGLLKVTIQEANIMKPPSKLFSLDPYVKVKMSNQQYCGYVHKKAGRFDLFNESFQFVINSCYKSEGRFVSIQVWDKQMFGEKIIGAGTIDIDPVIYEGGNGKTDSPSINSKDNQINSKNQDSSNNLRIFKCKKKIFLSHGVQNVGYLNTKFQFFQQSVEVIGFKFIFVSLRRVSSIFTTMNVRIQVLAGEQVLSTQKKKDKYSDKPPSWEDEILIFNIPSSLRQCIVRVLDDEDQIGHYKLRLAQIIDKKGEHEYIQQLEGPNGLSGIIKFMVLVGVSSVAKHSKKILQMEQLEPRLILESQPQLKSRIQPQRQQKQKKLYQSQEKTNFQTLVSSSDQSKYTTRNKEQKSFLSINEHELKP